MKSVFSISIALFLLASCGEGGESILGGNTSLPENPKKIEIRWNESGGMLPEGESIFISEDSCYTIT